MKRRCFTSQTCANEEQMRTTIRPKFFTVLDCFTVEDSITGSDDISKNMDGKFIKVLWCSVDGGITR